MSPALAATAAWLADCGLGHELRRLRQDRRHREHRRALAPHARRGCSTTSISIAGPTPSGQPLFPVPLGDPDGQTCSTHADMRLRTDLSVLLRPAAVWRSRRASTCSTTSRSAARPRASPPRRTTQQPTGDAPRQARLRRGAHALRPPRRRAAWAAHWGLGMLANGGDCARLRQRRRRRSHRVRHAARRATSGPSPTTSRPTGPFVPDRSGTARHRRRAERDVHTVTFAVLRWRARAGAQRRRRPERTRSSTAPTSRTAGRTTTCRRPTCRRRSPCRSTRRRSWRAATRATALDGWSRSAARGSASRPRPRTSRLASTQPSLIPGVAVPRRRRRRTQLGVALESDAGDRRRQSSARPRRRLRERRFRPRLRRLPGRERGRAHARRSRRPAGQSALRHPRQQLPLPPRLPHRSHPVPRDHRHRDRRRLRAPHVRVRR